MPYADAAPSGKLKLTDEDFLRVVAAERANAIGFDDDDDVAKERAEALRYLKGEMRDVPALTNRSKVVSTDVSDAVLTVMPDLLEIFLGGEEIGAFRPLGPDDVEAAEQETEVVNHVVMNENDAFGLVHDTIYDALTVKTGIAHAWVEEYTETQTYTLDSATAIEIEALPQGHEIVAMGQSGVDPDTGEALYTVQVQATRIAKKVCAEPVSPDDFAVARDTKRISDAVYCVMRSRPRAQELKARGFDPDLVDELPGSSWRGFEQDDARDTVGETSDPMDSPALHDLRQVVVHVHVIRVDADGDGKPELWRVDTDETDGVLLQKQKLSAVPFAVGTPYRQPHRFFGRSLADLLMEIQRIKTVLMRNALDAAYFALNQRHEVADDASNEFTITDLLNNQPGMPVRVKRLGAVQAIQPGAMGYDPFQALEYFATVAEQRSGIARNAQGLNPDTLHDTAKGAQVLMSAAQRRVRMIARVLAETLFKDLYVLVHGLLREHGSKEMTVPLRGKFVRVDPTSWGARKDMKIEIGMGGGREHDMMMLELIKQDMTALVEAQQAPPGPVVDARSFYQLAKKRAERAGVKGVDAFYNDPTQQMQQATQQPPPPDPALVKVQADVQMQQAKLQMETQAKQAQSQIDIEAKRADMQLRREMAMLEMQQERELAEQRMDQEMQLAMRKADQEMRIAAYRAQLEAQVGVHQANRQAETALPAYRPGGALDR